MFREQKKVHYNYYIKSIVLLSVEEEEVLHYRVEQLSVSPENTVIHYLHLDVGQENIIKYIDCKSDLDNRVLDCAVILALPGLTKKSVLRLTL